MPRARRYSWKGFIKVSLVAVPIRAFTAAKTARGKIALHQLHKTCHSRVKYQKTCPIHGPISKNEIVSGYEYAKGQYAIIDSEELDELKSDGDRTINVESFVEPEAIDRVYYTDRSYYLVPDGKVAQKPYAVIAQGMEEEKRFAVGMVTLYGRPQVVLLRPVNGLFVMTQLSYAAQLKEPTEFEGEVPRSKVTEKELQLARSLIESTSDDKFEFRKIEDHYTEQLKDLIDAKVEGREVVAEPQAEEPKVINLMDALKRSVATVQRAKPERHQSPSRRRGARTKKKTA